MSKNIVAVGLACCALFISGCGQNQPKLVSIAGTLTLNGQPLDEVQVEFMPDPEKEGVGLSSTSETDSSGRFVMYYGGQKNKPGVAVGWSRVVLQDFKVMNSRDNPIAPRFTPQYTTAFETPIRIEVKGESSDLKIELNEYLK